MNGKLIKKTDIRLKLILGFAVTPIIMICLNFIGISKVNSVDNSLTIINDINSVKQRFAIDFRGSVHDRAISLRDVVLYGEKKNMEESIKEIRVLDKFYAEAAQRMDEIFANTNTSEEEIRLLKEIKAIEAETLPLIEKTIESKLMGQNELAWQLLMHEANPHFKTWLLRINKFIDHEENLNQTESEGAREIVSSFQYLMMWLTAVSVLLSIFLAFYMIRSIIQSLKVVAVDIDQSSTQIQEVSKTISLSSQNLAEGSKTQATSIESIGAALEELSAMVQRNAENSKRTTSVASESKEKARLGVEVVHKMLSAMTEISTSNQHVLEQVEESNRNISEIVNFILEIGEKTKIINDIVFQTKLLSFNASVEAARAGESGKGFAVVAEEVGNLAQMSGNAAKEITQLLHGSKEKVENIVQETKTRVSSQMEISQEKVTIGSDVANQCAEVLSQIESKINEVSLMAEEISNATKEQSLGFRDITKNISSLDGVTQMNSKMASENADTIQNLNTQAHELRKAFDALSVLIGIRGEEH